MLYLYLLFCIIFSDCITFLTYGIFRLYDPPEDTHRFGLKKIWENKLWLISGGSNVAWLYSFYIIYYSCNPCGPNIDYHRILLWSMFGSMELWARLRVLAIVWTLQCDSIWAITCNFQFKSQRYTLLAIVCNIFVLLKGGCNKGIF